MLISSHRKLLSSKAMVLKDVSSGGTVLQSLHVTGHHQSSDFTVSSDGHGGTMIQDPPGTLTVSNGTNQVTLNLLGNYIGASWMLSHGACVTASPFTEASLGPGQQHDCDERSPACAPGMFQKRSGMRLRQRQLWGRRGVADHRRAMTVACCSKA